MNTLSVWGLPAKKKGIDKSQFFGIVQRGLCICLYGSLSEDRSANGPQWFPELQWYVEEETSSRNEHILPREEETTSMKDKMIYLEDNIQEGAAGIISG